MEATIITVIFCFLGLLILILEGGWEGTDEKPMSLQERYYAQYTWQWSPETAFEELYKNPLWWKHHEEEYFNALRSELETQVERVKADISCEAGCARLDLRMDLIEWGKKHGVPDPQAVLPHTW